MDEAYKSAIFDTHAHYDDEQFDLDRNDVITKIKEAGVRKVVNIGCNMTSSRKSAEMSETVEGFYAAVGIHPSDAEECSDETLRELELLARGKRVVAIGEIGLDYYWNDFPKEIQQNTFEKQLVLAEKLDMPVVIHSREAAEDTFNMIKAHSLRLNAQGKQAKGVIHCYSGSVEMAGEYVKRGYYIGVGGVVTYKNARKLVEVVEAIPLENLVIETDCPYLSPVPNRGKRNDSANLKYVLEKICEIKGADEETVRGQLWKNAHRLYEITDEG